MSENLPEWNLSVCGGCLCWVANGDDTSLDLESAEYAAAIRARRAERADVLDTDGRRAGGRYVVMVPACDTDDTGDCTHAAFTRVACDLCGVTGRDDHGVHAFTVAYPETVAR
jgi:hypothetical protein